MRILKAQPIRRQVVAITCALLVPFAIAAAWSSSRARRERASEVLEQAGSVAATAGAYLNQYLTGIDSMASALVRHPAVMGLDSAQTDRLFAEVHRGQPLILNIVLTDTRAALKGTAIPQRPGISAALSATIGDVAASGKPQVSELLTGVVTGKPSVVLAYPVHNAQDMVVGVLALGLDLAHLQTLFSDIPLPEGSVVTLTDEKGRVLARSRDAERYIGKLTDPRATTPPRDVPRTSVLTGVDGIERFYGTAVVERGPWLLSVGIPTSVAAARVAPLYRRNLTIAVLAIGAVLLLALALSTLMTRGVNGVREAVRKIADGDLSPPVRSAVPNRELAELQDAFITMAANLRETHHALDRQVEQERKMREVLQSLQRQVVRQERLAAVGVLVSGVAHELNNPLQAILGTAELLERHGGLSQEALDEIAFVKTQSGRAREIIRNLSRFSRVSSRGRRRSSTCATSSPRSCSSAAAISTTRRSSWTSSCPRSGRCTPTSRRSSRSRSTS